MAATVGAAWGLGGDVSAWDTSWDLRHCLVVAEVVVQRMMAAYDKLGFEPGAKRRAVGRWLEFWMIGLHQSGDSDYSATNGILHATTRVASLRIVFGSRQMGSYANGVGRI